MVALRRIRAGNRRGIALGLVIITALVFAVAAYAVLFMAGSFGQRANFQKRNAKARYAAEAGLVWAMQRLWVNPSECFAANPDYVFDSDGDPSTPPDVPVDITTSSPCPDPNFNLQLHATVKYTVSSTVP